MAYTADRYHDFSCGHRVHGHESKCAHLHGHNYRVHFTCAPVKRRGNGRRFMGQPDMVTPDLDSVGRVIDFGVIKSTLCQWLEDNWDHRFLLWEHDPAAAALLAVDKEGVVLVPFNPTAENMAQYLVEVVGPQLLADTDVGLVAVRVDETRKCSASFYIGG